MLLEINRVMMGDSYKYTHPNQYPVGTVNQYDYAEARSTNVYDKTVFVGLQGILKEFFTTPITRKEVTEAAEYAEDHGIGFCKEGWDIIVKEYNGFLPVTIKGVREGTVLPNKNVLFTVELSVDDERIFWIVSWLETFLMKVWYTCNIATRSYFVKKMLIEMGKITDENPFVDYQYHNFGDRGSSTVSAAIKGGFAHLTCFKGTDNFGSVKYVKDIYNVPSTKRKEIAHSIDATEHSTVTSRGKDGEQDFVMNFLEKNKGKNLIACVGDSYDIFNFTDFITKGEFKNKIENEDYPTFVIRPDSGDAVDVINTMLNIMEKNNVAFDVNDKGYKIFKKYRIIWGDGINMDTMRNILTTVTLRGYSTQNIAFGSGGWLMQQHDRDTLGFAIKCSEITFKDGSTRDIFKDPITAPGKKSKKGKVTTYKNFETNEYFTDIVGKYKDSNIIFDALEVIFRNGQIISQYSIFEIRDYIDQQLIKDID
jgi:nicotinamide phosphoribosyltransferase